MARLALVLVLAVAVSGCGDVAADPVTPRDAAPSCIADGEPYDAAGLRARLDTLAAPALDGRLPGTRGDLAARAFIAERFRCLGLVPAGKDGGYEQPFTAQGKDTANLVGLVRGRDPGVASEIIVVGAHHDHLGNKHLGANDDGSGVIAMLAIAQAVRQAKEPPRRTIAFVAFGAEEMGLLGSQYFVGHTSLAMDKVVYDVNLDMVGSYASKGFVAAMGTFGKSPGRKILDKLVDNKLAVGLGGRGVGSDHLPFCKLGIPYVFFWTPDGRCYHETCDTIANIDLPHMAQIATLAGRLVGELADSPLDLAASRKKLGCGQ
jgi:hypothetical protein